MIDQLFDHSGVEFHLAHQIDQNAWIDIATASAHHHPAGRGQAHAGVDRFAFFDRSNACAIAEMGDYEPVRQIGPELAHDRLARKTMKPVALNTLR